LASSMPCRAIRNFAESRMSISSMRKLAQPATGLNIHCRKSFYDCPPYTPLALSAAERAIRPREHCPNG
jgi:hypothetical protein